MNENIRFMQVVETLKEGGAVTDYVQLACILETNKAGISDIKSGRKKLSIDILRRMKLSYPSISLDWIVLGEGTPFVQEKANNTIPNNDTTSGGNWPTKRTYSTTRKRTAKKCFGCSRWQHCQCWLICFKNVIITKNNI